jgi:DNA-binding transcriptional LysR family regulator
MLWHLVDAHLQVALDMLRGGRVDAAIIFRYDDATPDDIRTVHLFDDPMYLLSLERGQTLRDHRESAWIAGCTYCRREFVDACERAGFTPRIVYTGDDVIVEQALVAAGMGVTTIPGLALRAHRAPGIEASELPDFRRRLHLAMYGDAPDPPATAVFITALQQTVEQLTPGS